jgi:hypothetical protein
MKTELDVGRTKLRYLCRIQPLQYLLQQSKIDWID